MTVDCGKKGHARRGCSCDRCQAVRERERAYGARWREENREQVAANQREYRRKNNNLQTKKYEKTPKGYLMRSYRNMTNRVNGLNGPGSWVGQPILTREDFYEWSLDHPDFRRLYRRYMEAGCPMRLAPSVNRIDPTRGYTLDNIEWVTHGVNSSLASLSKTREADRALEGVARLVA